MRSPHPSPAQQRSSVSRYDADDGSDDDHRDDDDDGDDDDARPI